VIQTILAGRLDFFVDLYNGDPVAWGILIVVAVGSIGWSIYKQRSAKGEGGGNNSEG